MKVYALWDGDYEDRHIVGLYSKLDAAQRRDHGHVPVWDDADPDDSYMRCRWVRNHHRAKFPQPITLEQREVPVVNGIAVLPDGREVSVPPGQRLIVPVVPEEFMRGPVMDWTEDCSYAIEAYDLLP